MSTPSQKVSFWNKYGLDARAMTSSGKMGPSLFTQVGSTLSAMFVWSSRSMIRERLSESMSIITRDGMKDA